MADDVAQGPQDTAWGAVDAAPDPRLPTMGFDEPLVWPESPVWDDIPTPRASDVTGVDGHIVLPPLPTIAPVATVARTATAVEPERPRNLPPTADPDAQGRPTDADLDPDATHQPAGPLAGLGGGSGRPPAEGDDHVGAPAAAAAGGGVSTLEAGGNVPWPAPVDDRLGEGPPDQLPPDVPALGSIWSNDLRADPHDLDGFGGFAAPAIDADTERKGGGLTRRFDVRPGNAAVIGLISVVSLVLLGMFLSVRARNNDVPTDASQTRPAGDQVAVTGPLNTVAAPTTVTTTATTTVPEPAINLSELVAATEATAAATGSGAAATTTPTARASAPTGGGSATTTPVTQPTATTAPPPPTTEATAPPATSTPVQDDTPTTVRRTTPTPTPTFTIPNITLPPISMPRITVPARD